MKTFDKIYILDLHGSSKKKERCPDGSKDENVFDIQQGVSIGFFVKTPGKKTTVKVKHDELWGLREVKYAWLLENDVSTTSWIKLEPKPESFYFIQRDLSEEEEYKAFLKLTDLFSLSSSGIQTKRDQVAVAMSKEGLIATLKDFATMEVEAIRTKYDLPKDGRKVCHC
jgi:predicted helicase